MAGFNWLVCTDSQRQFAPIVRIDEGVEDHFTQILFILRASFSEESGFTGWRPFTKQYIIDRCKADERVYIENWDNGEAFVQEFPFKIAEFLAKFCVYEKGRSRRGLKKSRERAQWTRRGSFT